MYIYIFWNDYLNNTLTIKNTILSFFPQNNPYSTQGVMMQGPSDDFKIITLFIWIPFLKFKR